MFDHGWFRYRRAERVGGKILLRNSVMSILDRFTAAMPKSA